MDAAEIRKLTPKDCQRRGEKDGRYGWHDSDLWKLLSRKQREAYDTGNQAGTEEPNSMLERRRPK